MNILKAISLITLAITLPSVVILAQTKTLVYTDHEPLGNMRTRFINEIFFSAIEKESNGRLKIDAHWGGKLSSSYDALSKVGKEGVVDMATVVPEYSPNETPLHQVFKSFPVGPTGEKQVDFFRRVYEEIPDLSQELEKANVEKLIFCTGYPVAFFSTKPLNNLRNIREQKWRTASFWHRDFLKNAGAIPISMPWNDGIFKALQAGTLDGLMVNVDSGYDLKVHEVAPNILLSKDIWLGHLYLLVMNKNTWDGLEKEDRDAIQHAAATSYKALGSVMNSSFDTQIEDLEKAGAKIRILAPEEVKEWKTETDYHNLQSVWVKEQQDKGIKNAATVMKKVSIIMKD